MPDDLTHELNSLNIEEQVKQLRNTKTNIKENSYHRWEAIVGGRKILVEREIMGKRITEEEARQSIAHFGEISDIYPVSPSYDFKY